MYLTALFHFMENTLFLHLWKTTVWSILFGAGGFLFFFLLLLGNFHVILSWSVMFLQNYQDNLMENCLTYIFVFTISFSTFSTFIILLFSLTSNKLVFFFYIFLVLSVKSTSQRPICSMFTKNVFSSADLYGDGSDGVSLEVWYL